MLFLVIFYIELMLFKIAFRHVVSEGNFKTVNLYPTRLETQHYLFHSNVRRLLL